MWKAAFKKFEGIWSAYQTISHKIFKGRLPQNLLSPLLNAFPHLSHLWAQSVEVGNQLDLMLSYEISLKIIQCKQFIKTKFVFLE